MVSNRVTFGGMKGGGCRRGAGRASGRGGLLDPGQRRRLKRQALSLCAHAVQCASRGSGPELTVMQRCWN